MIRFRSNQQMNQTIGGRLVLPKSAGLPSSNVPNKYRAIRTTVDGLKFDSKREAERYMALRQLLRIGEISDLRLQVKFPITVNNQKICTYIADFTYKDSATGDFVVEDSKGMKTRTYVLKKKLVKAVYGIEIREV